jgi:hypothetical protein
MFVLDVTRIQPTILVWEIAARSINCHLNSIAHHASNEQKILTPIQMPDIFSLWKQQRSVQSN